MAALILVKKNSSPFLKIGETRAIFIPSGKILVWSEKLKICLSGLKIPLAQNLGTDDEISSNPGLLLDFKLLKASSNSWSWRAYSCTTAFEIFMNCLKTLEVAGIEDADLGAISVKYLLNY